MPTTLALLGRGPVTYESACEKEFNVIDQLAYVPATEKLYHDLWQQRHAIAALTKQHLRLGSQDTCTVLDPHEWIRGGFNICIFVEVKSGGSNTRLVFPSPMPYKLAETRYPGTVDEKLGCEVGAYVWIQEKCPGIRIPHLLGFGFSDGRHFTHSKHRPFFSRIARMCWRYVSGFFGYPLLSQYSRQTMGHHLHLRSAYMLLEYIGPETGEMLSATWDKFRGDPDRRQRLFSGMSRIMLSLARIPQPRIGSFHFNDDGTITLSNRPRLCSTIILENEGATRILQRDVTYNSTEAFVSEMLTLHDHRFLSQPNAIYSEDDCRSQMAAKTLLRALSHRYIRREYRSGPFLPQLTDLHASNIFVDKEWNIKCLIDLEWICALPSEMLDVPYWLTGRSIDEIEGEYYDEFDRVRQEFMRIFQEQEHGTTVEHASGISVSQVMQDTWKSKGVWFWHCLSSVNAMYFLLEQHLCPAGSLSTNAESAISQFWCESPEDLIRKKLDDKKRYDDELRCLFGE